eukprot:GILK01012265.1.p1 GENE.GILK01012265.1~~GILK01012265.1.p1  ORF type:complete len:535 (+),score=83.34 GILK01012265.1:60-1664(+)
MSKQEHISVQTTIDNIQQCLKVADIIQTTLGPYGSDKLIVNARGETITSNDGATILKCMNLQHPVARLLVDASSTQDRSVGDGTTSVVLLTAELLRAAMNLLSSGLHETYIIDGYKQAANMALQIIHEVAVSAVTHNLSVHQVVRQIVSTSLGSKVLNVFGVHFIDLIVEAILGSESNPLTKPRQIHQICLVKKSGGSSHESRLVSGLVLDRPLCSGATISRNNVTMLVSNLNFRNWSDMKAAVAVTTYQDGLDAGRLEREEIRRICTHIKSLGVELLINLGPIYPVAVQCLTDLSILCIENAGFELIKLVAMATNTIVVSDVTQIEANQLGRAGVVESILIGEKSSIQLSDCGVGAVCSILLRSPLGSLVDEAERACHDAVCAVHAFLEDPRVVAGGGAVHFEIAQRVRQFRPELNQDKSVLAVYAFADALEMIPRTLARNAGLDVPMLITQAHTLLSQQHEAATLGVDLEKGEITNLFKLDPAIIEPVQILLHAVRSASTLAQTILNIDEVVYRKPQQSAKSLGLFGPRPKR